MVSLVAKIEYVIIIKIDTRNNGWTKKKKLRYSEETP
jgi:hypothetical protein